MSSWDLGFVTVLQSEQPAKILTSRSGRLTCKAGERTSLQCTTLWTLCSGLGPPACQDLTFHSDTITLGYARQWGLLFLVHLPPALLGGNGRCCGNCNPCQASDTLSPGLTGAVSWARLYGASYGQGAAKHGLLMAADPPTLG